MNKLKSTESGHIEMTLRSIADLSADLLEHAEKNNWTSFKDTQLDRELLIEKNKKYLMLELTEKHSQVVESIQRLNKKIVTLANEYKEELNKDIQLHQKGDRVRRTYGQSI